MDLSVFRLNNYWLPVIWLLGSGSILSMFPKTALQVNGKTETRWNRTTALILVLPLILWAGARGGFGDSVAYARHFQQASASLLSIPGVILGNGKDKGFSVLMICLKALGLRNHSTFFLLIAAVQMLCMVYSFRRYSKHYWICIYLFVASTDYYSWMFNGMRQFLAATIIFAALDLVAQKKYLSFLAVALLATTIHGSALIMIPLTLIMDGPVMNKKVFLLLLGAILVIPFSEQFMPLLEMLLADTQYSTITGDEIWRSDDGTNIIRVLIYSVPALIAFVGRRYIMQSKNSVMNLCINASVVTMALYLVSAVTSGIYVGRLPIYTTLHGYMALPWLVEEIFEEQTARLIKLMMLGAYLVLYYYQMGSMWGLL